MNSKFREVELLRFSFSFVHPLPRGSGLSMSHSSGSTCVVLCSLEQVALSVEVDQLKMNISGVCDARRLLRRRSGGKGKTGYSQSVLNYDTEFLLIRPGYICYSVRPTPCERETG